MVVVVIIAKALHLLHVPTTEVHTSFFMLGCNVVKLFAYTN